MYSVGAKGAKGKGAAAKGAAAAGAAGAAVGAGAAGAAGAAANSSSNTGPGFSEVDLDAANNGGLTVADAPATANSLGLDIECVCDDLYKRDHEAHSNIQGKRCRLHRDYSDGHPSSELQPSHGLRLC